MSDIRFIYTTQLQFVLYDGEKCNLNGNKAIFNHVDLLHSVFCCVHVRYTCIVRPHVAPRESRYFESETDPYGFRFDGLLFEKRGGPAWVQFETLSVSSNFQFEKQTKQEREQTQIVHIFLSVL